MEGTVLFLQKSSPSFLLNTLPSHVHPKRNNPTKYIISTTTTFAKKSDLSENSTTQQQQLPTFSFPLPNPILARSVIAVLGLGFVDAGYSGDWSRIGVISKEIEDLLKVAAFIVIPLCIVLIVSITREEKS